MREYSFDGLKRQPTWEELVRQVSAGGVPDIPLPDRTATYNALMNPFVSAWEDQQKAIIASQRAQQDYWLKKPQMAPMATKHEMDDDFHSVVSQLDEDVGGTHERVMGGRYEEWLALDARTREAQAARQAQQFDIATQIDPDEPMQDAAQQEGVDIGHPPAVQDQADGGGEVLGLRPTGWAAGGAGFLAGAGAEAAVIRNRVATAMSDLSAILVSPENLADHLPFELRAAALEGGVLEELGFAASGARMGMGFGPYGAAAGAVIGAGIGAASLAVGAEGLLHNSTSWMGGGGSSEAEQARHNMRPEDRNAPAPLRDFTSNNIRPPDGSSSAALPASMYRQPSMAQYSYLREQVAQPGPGEHGSGLGRSPPPRQSGRPYAQGWLGHG
jgi:hypothetical protein